VGRKVSFSGAVFKDKDGLAAIRVAMETAFIPICGRSVIEPKPADSLEKSRGVKGYWISWPGVDTSDNAPTLIYFHGGGIFCGNALYAHAFTDRVSQLFGVRVLTVEYRLCPEHTPMEAVADGVAAYRHLIEDLKVPNKQVFIAGESGGGQMVLLVVQAIAQLGLPSPAAAWAMSPVCTVDDDDHLNFRGPMYKRDLDHFFAHPEFQLKIGHVLRRVGQKDELPGKDPRASPLYGSFTNVCPLYFSVSDSEVYLNEGLATFKKAREAGVATRLAISAHGAHAYPLFNTIEAVAEIANVCAWMKQFSSL